MSFDLFTCCTGADDAKYIHPCACPTTSLQFQSELKYVNLCGRIEFENAANNISLNTPPKIYKTLTNTYSETVSCPSWCPNIVESKNLISNGTRNWTIDSNGNCTNPPGSTIEIYQNLYGNNDCDGFKQTVYNTNYLEIASANSLAQSNVYSANIGSSVAYCAGASNGTHSYSITTTLSNEDTEQDAILRTPSTTGQINYSLWELRASRSSAYSFTYVTSKYTIDCSDLIVGFNYSVAPTIRRRTVYLSGRFPSYGTFEDVEVTPYTFTATATTETIDDNGNPIDVDLVQGYQYQVTGATIEKV
jgi:hypothetical protein